MLSQDEKDRSHAFWIAFSTVAMFGLLIVALNTLPSVGAISTSKLGYFLTFLFGAIVGTVELMGRYPYAPMRAIFTRGALVYVLVNAVASCGAYFLITDGGFSLGWGGGRSDDPAKFTKDLLAAGFGSAFILRSSIFRIQVGEQSIGIGPSAVLDTLLIVSDRSVDRTLAVQRGREMFSLFKDVPPTAARSIVADFTLSMMQNVSAADRTKILQEIGTIMSNTTSDPSVKAAIAGMALANVVGPEVLKEAMGLLADIIERHKRDLERNQTATAGGPATNAAATTSVGRAQLEAELSRAEPVEKVPPTDKP